MYNQFSTWKNLSFKHYGQNLRPLKKPVTLFDYAVTGKVGKLVLMRNLNQNPDRQNRAFDTCALYFLHLMHVLCGSTKYHTPTKQGHSRFRGRGGS